MIARLIPKNGEPPVEIRRDLTLVGRHEKVCDLTIAHASISKIHCLLARTDGLLFFRDLASTNGTRVNGQKVTRGALLPGDELAFGKVRYEVFLGPGETNHDASEATVSPADGTDELDVIDLDV